MIDQYAQASSPALLDITEFPLNLPSDKLLTKLSNGASTSKLSTRYRGLAITNLNMAYGFTMAVRLLTQFSLFTVCAFLAANPAATDNWIYNAKEGDTLWDICLEYTNKHGCWIELQRYNNILSDRVIPVGSQIRIPTSWLISPPVVGEVLSVNGDVTYREFGNNNSEAILVQGQSVRLGAVITSHVGSTRILLHPHSEILISPESKLELQNLSGPVEENNLLELYLERGSAEAEIEPNTGTQFLIGTPTAIAAVRGTRYRTTTLGDNDGTTRTEVLTGVVKVSAQNSLMVSSGYGVLTAKDGVVSKPKALLPAPEITKGHMNLPLPVVLEWSSYARESGWQVKLLDPKNGGTIIQRAKTSKPHIEFTHLLETCYTLLVRAIDHEGFHGMESESTVCVVPELTAVTGVSIEKSVDNGTWTVNWVPLTGAEKYIVEVAIDNSFHNIIDTHEVSGQEAILNVQSGTDFSVRIYAQDTYGNRGPTSEPIEYREKGILIPLVFMTYAVLILIL